jgi:biopolymer transport protein ExbD
LESRIVRRRFTLPASHAGKINVTPLIDVVMCLIIFYLLVGRLAMDRQAGVRLPGSAIGVEEKGSSSLVINVMMGEGSVPARVMIDGRAIDAPTLKERLALYAGASPEAVPLVQIRADRRLAYASVSPVLAACRGAGLRSVLLTTQREEGRP